MDREKRNKVIELISPILEGEGYDCLEVEWDFHERALRVFIDGPSGIVMEDCLKANKLLVDLEELDQLVKGSYRLEISSPGIERPLRQISHFADAIGEQVSVKLNQKVDNRKQGIGRLIAITEDENLVLERESGEWQVPFNFVESAKLVYDWSQV